MLVDVHHAARLGETCKAERQREAVGRRVRRGVQIFFTDLRPRFTRRASVPWAVRSERATGLSRHQAALPCSARRTAPFNGRDHGNARAPRETSASSRRLGFIAFTTRTSSGNWTRRVTGNARTTEKRVKNSKLHLGVAAHARFDGTAAARRARVTTQDAAEAHRRQWLRWRQPFRTTYRFGSNGILQPTAPLFGTTDLLQPSAVASLCPTKRPARCAAVLTFVNVLATRDPLPALAGSERRSSLQPIAPPITRPPSSTAPAEGREDVASWNASDLLAR